LRSFKAGRAALAAMLKDGATPPDGLWADLAILEPVRDFKARHASTLLAFEATVEAVQKALAASEAPSAAPQRDGTAQSGATA
jgi:NifU-like protein involved in Fe-S cluster formation